MEEDRTERSLVRRHRSCRQPTSAEARLGSAAGRPRSGGIRAGLRGHCLGRARRAGKTPIEIVGELNKAINAVLSDPATKERFAGLGAEMTPAALGQYIAGETEKWAKVVKTAHIKVE